REQASLGGGAERIAKQKKDGYLTAEERIAMLVDPGTFLEMNTLAGPQPAEFGPPPAFIPRDGVITGFGRVNGRTAGIFAHDKTVQGGSLGNVQAAKITNIIRRACELKVPVVALQDSVGARIQEGNKNVGFDSIFYSLTQASGVVPLISVILGRCAGGIAYSSALMDFIIMVRGKSVLFITGPDVIKAVTHEEVSLEKLGGADVHSEKSGVCDLVAADEAAAISTVKQLLSFLPSGSHERPPQTAPRNAPDGAAAGLQEIIPSEARKFYDMKKIIRGVLDGGDFFEVKARYARNILTGFGRVEGESVGIIANQPTYLAGALDVDASDKASRFIRFCDAFNIPVLTFVDIPGYLPGVDQEYRGIIRHGAKMLFAYAEATVPKITIIVRKDYGGGKQAMCSKPMGADLVLAWPSAELAVMGAEGAVNVICRKEIQASSDPDATRKRLIEEYQQIFEGPFESARKMYVDDVIKPEETREKIVQGLRIFRNKKPIRMEKKHGNIPV
ncbi:MAG TPA: acyl-CoA carboxylase subunit beta, partial [Thermodesulfobacteriota bacterium]|nr:acyl-CoA carboxylase subunit beta [Thermodesulfobacteriota bacterium]